MRGTPDAARVADASARWVWVPQEARTLGTEDYLLVRYPDWFVHPLEMPRFHPSGDPARALDAALDAARSFGVPVVVAWARLDAPAGAADLFASRGGVPDETLDVLAMDLEPGLPDLGPAADGTVVRWVADLDDLRAFEEVGVQVFGGRPTPGSALASTLDVELRTQRTGAGGRVVAWDGARPVGSAGLTVEDGVTRLWGGAVLPDARGRGVYRALLAERLAEGRRQGAPLALVKGRVESSGPVLRRAGFHAYGREVSYAIPL